MTEQHLREALAKLMHEASHHLSTDAIYGVFVAVTKAAELAYAADLTSYVGGLNEK